MQQPDDTLPIQERDRRRRELFAMEYVSNGMNGTQAARSAGYAPASARVQASRMLRRPDVKARVEQLVNERVEASKLRADEIVADLRRLAQQAMVPVPAFDSRGRPIPGVTRALDGALAVRALELLGKALTPSLFSDRVAQEVVSEVEVVFQTPTALDDDDETAPDIWAGEVARPRLAVASSEADRSDESDVEADPPRPRHAGGGAVIVL